MASTLVQERGVAAELGEAQLSWWIFAPAKRTLYFLMFPVGVAVVVQIGDYLYEPDIPVVVFQASAG
jgi:hypothetical protein